MKTRIDPTRVSPQVLKPLFALGAQVEASGLEHPLLELVKMRASQINGCAYCLDMHSKDARAQGETEQRLYLLPAWRETSLYSERERAALAWTEALTLLPETRAPDDAYEALQAELDEEEQVKLTLLIVAINGWNRVQVGFRGVHPVGERTEGGDALPERDDLAVEQHVVPDGSQRLELGPGHRDVVLVARPHPDPAVRDLHQRPDAVPLHLVGPVRPGRHVVTAGGQHRLHAPHPDSRDRPGSATSPSGR